MRKLWFLFPLAFVLLALAAFTQAANASSAPKLQAIAVNGEVCEQGWTYSPRPVVTEGYWSCDAGYDLDTTTNPPTCTKLVAEESCPVVNFSTSHMVCPSNPSAYTSTDSTKPCWIWVGTGPNKVKMYADEINEPFSTNVQYIKSQDPHKCHKPAPSQCGIPSWAIPAFNALPQSLDSIPAEYDTVAATWNQPVYGPCVAPSEVDPTNEARCRSCPVVPPTCGLNAQLVDNVCVCLAGYEGDPYTECTEIVVTECGLNAHLENDICVCDEGYEGDPNTECILIVIDPCIENPGLPQCQIIPYHRWNCNHRFTKMPNMTNAWEYMRWYMHHAVACSGKYPGQRWH